MKNILPLLSIIAVVSSARAQGLIDFNNSVQAASQISVELTPGNGTLSLTGGPAGTYDYALFYSLTASSDPGSGFNPGFNEPLYDDYVVGDSAFTFGDAYATSSATAGRVSGSTAQVVSGISGGASAYFVILGWSSNIGSTVGDVENWLEDPALSVGNGTDYIGESSVEALTLGNGGIVPTPIALNSVTIPGFVLYPVVMPEPSIVCLTGFGGLALLALRRKNR